ncbi:MAG: transmembrane 220 family protein [Verrucomicrobiota bacterium]
MTRHINLIFSIFLCYFIWVQFNDVDTWLWVLIYASAIIILLLGFFSLPIKWLSFIFAFISLCIAVAISFKIDNFSIDDERTREVGGLVFAAVFVLVAGIRKPVAEKEIHR